MRSAKAHSAVEYEDDVTDDERFEQVLLLCEYVGDDLLADS